MHHVYTFKMAEKTAKCLFAVNAISVAKTIVNTGFTIYFHSKLFQLQYGTFFRTEPAIFVRLVAKQLLREVCWVNHNM